MKGIVQDRYGSLEAFRLGDIDRPPVGDDQALVRVRAASVHVGDWILMVGRPFVIRGDGRARGTVIAVAQPAGVAA